MENKEAIEILKGIDLLFGNGKFSDSINLGIKALEEKNLIIYRCPHSEEEFMEGDYYFLLSNDGVITNHTIDKKIIYTNKEYRFHKKEDAIKWSIDKFEKNPLFTFEGHDYFEGDEC